MTQTRFVLSDTDRQKLEDFLMSELEICYSAIGSDLTIFGEEKKPLRKLAEQFNMIVIKSEYGKLQIDIISAAGGVGTFRKDAFSESDFVIKMNQKLRDYATSNQLDLEEVLSNL